MSYSDFLNWTYTGFPELIGKTVVKIDGMEVAGNDVINFVTSDGSEYRMRHYQNWCECGYVESVVGDIQDLIGDPILVAKTVSESGDEDINHILSGAVTYTLYKLATCKGYVEIRWYGISKGYYSKSVYFERKNKDVV